MVYRFVAGDRVIFKPGGIARLSGIPDKASGVVVSAEGDSYNWCHVDFGDYGDYGCWQADLELMVE